MIQNNESPKIISTNKKGFTLIELLVVISIIGLLSTVILASLNIAKSKANDSKRLADIKQISNALELYYNDRGVYPGLAGSPGWWGYEIISVNNTKWQLLQTELSPYLSKLPVDPKNNDVPCYANGAHFYTYRIYNTSDGNQHYGLYASLENPKSNSSDPKDIVCCTTPYPSNCMYKASNGGVGIEK